MPNNVNQQNLQNLLHENNNTIVASFNLLITLKKQVTFIFKRKLGSNENMKNLEVSFLQHQLNKLLHYSNQIDQEIDKIHNIINNPILRRYADKQVYKDYVKEYKNDVRFSNNLYSKIDLLQSILDKENRPQTQFGKSKISCIFSLNVLLRDLKKLLF